MFSFDGFVYVTSLYHKIINEMDVIINHNEYILFSFNLL